MSNQNLKVRPAKESDYPAVNALYRHSYDLLHQNIPESFKATTEKVLWRGTFINDIEDEKSLVIVAEIEGKVVGQLYAYVDDFDETPLATACHRVEIGEISVLPKYKRQGIGTMLMKEAERWARKKKIVDLSVLTYDYNKEAIKFYEQNGYKKYSIKLEKKLDSKKE